MNTEIPSHCPGTESENAGKSSGCEGCPNQNICASGEARIPFNNDLIKEKLSTVKHKILVFSGKGGVGKSTLTCMLARALANMYENKKVAVVDVDICGPSIPRVMGVLEEKIHKSGSGWSPVYVEDNLSVMSIGFLLNSADDAVIWRGAKKSDMVKKFLTEVDWNGEIEFMLIDTPPGTSDEHISLAEFLKGVPNVTTLLVSTPQEVSMLDVRKQIHFLRNNKVNISILGIIENMSPFKCPKCKVDSEVFPENSGGVQKMAQELNVPYLGNLPLDPVITRSCDEGTNPFEDEPDNLYVKNMKSLISSKFQEGKL